VELRRARLVAADSADDEQVDVLGGGGRGEQECEGERDERRTSNVERSRRP
jgi:hypothetical protein